MITDENLYHTVHEATLRLGNNNRDLISEQYQGCEKRYFCDDAERKAKLMHIERTT